MLLAITGVLGLYSLSPACSRARNVEMSALAIAWVPTRTGRDWRRCSRPAPRAHDVYIYITAWSA